MSWYCLREERNFLLEEKGWCDYEYEYEYECECERVVFYFSSSIAAWAAESRATGTR